MWKSIKAYEAPSHNRQLRALEREARQLGFSLQEVA